MRICVLGKYPPIEGGVSARTYWTCHMLARAGHNVFVVTNADETESMHREWFLPGDAERLEANYPGGGSVRASFTQARHDEDLYYIPQGRPTITRLASVAVEAVRRNDCELLIGWYLEPYVLAASLVAAWTQRPYLVCHAGSDLHDLAAQPELGPAYREAIRSSAGVISTILPGDGLGLLPGQVFGFPGLFLPAEFAASGPVMDLIGTARMLRSRGATAVLRTEPLPPGTTLIGAYGKLGIAKGTIELVRAVSLARARGSDVGLALAGGGPGWGAVIDEVHAAGIADVTVTLPMVTPWRIPAFIRACQALAFLERDFAVPLHRPVPPLEVLACGRPLLLSSDVALDVLPGRSPDDRLFDAVEIVDPRDADALAAAVVAVLSRARPTADQVAASLRDEADVARWYAEVFDRVLTPRSGRPTCSDEQTVVPEVERILARHCPAFVGAFGMQVVQRRLTEVQTAPNALMAAYAVVDASLPELRAAICGPDGPARKLAQLALAEHHALWARVDAEGVAGIAAFPLPVQRVPLLPTDAHQLDTLFPVASNWLKIAQFEVDAFAHLAAVASERANIDGVGRISGPGQILLFHKAPNLVPTIARISPGVRDILETADGTRSLRMHAEALAIEGERTARFLAAVRELHQTGVLMFRRDLFAS